jgi:hypothetical protein
MKEGGREREKEREREREFYNSMYLINADSTEIILQFSFLN